MTEPPPNSPSSCPALSRASTTSGAAGEDVDGRVKPGHDDRKKGLIVRIAATLVAIVCCLVGGFAAWIISLGPLPLEQARQTSVTIVDRNGKLLRAFAMKDGRWRLPVDSKKDVDPTYLKLLFAFEDQRFYEHAGVDPFALARAAWQLASRGRIVSGGSTITMQLARLMEEPAHHRSLSAKLRQMVRAIEIERRSARNRSSTSISRWRPLAAISRASAPPRSPISARSRSG